MSRGGYKRQLAVLLVVFVAASLCHIVGFALDPKKAITQYVHDVWTVEDGLPQNSILAITQTRDGYLWFGTWQGLVRFDGVRFSVFDRQNTLEIKSNYIYAFCEDRQGNLWIGTWSGLLRFRDGKFTSYTTRDGLSSDAVKAIYEDRQRNLWIGTPGGGLNRFSDGRFTSFTSKDGLAGDSVEAIYEDRMGYLWVGTLGGLSRFKDGKLITYTTKDGLPGQAIFSICEDQEGSLWFGAASGLYRFKDGKFTRFAENEGLLHKSVHSVFQDREGNLWVGAEGGGLSRFQNGKFIHFTTKDGLSHDTVWPIFEDREGSLWVGTWGGLNRFKDGIITVFTTKEGLSNDWARAVYEDREGSLWIGTLGAGLNLYKHGKFTRYTRKEGLFGDTVEAIYGDRKGNLWVATEGGGLNCFSNGKFVNYTSKEWLLHSWVTAIYEDQKGVFWIGTADGSLNHFKHGVFRGFAIKGEPFNGLVSSIYEDRKGNLWVGTERGIFLFKDGEFTDYTTQMGLPQSKVNSIYEDQEGVLWFGTRGDGLTRFKDGEFFTYTTKVGLFDDAVTAVLEDGTGNLWMGSFRGIFSVNKKELEALAQGRIASVKSTSYGIADGLKSLECNSTPPSGWKSKDGKLWFPTIKGIVMVDPDNAKRNTLPPPVSIEQAIFDKKPINLGQGAKLPAGRRDLEFHYTALSFLDPKRVQFKYKLEGYDKDWVVAGTRRVAYYTNLSPSAYRFRVIACNNDGVWNETGAAFDLYLLPHFYETTWFYVLCSGLSAIALILVGIGWYHRRVNREQMRRDAYSRQLIAAQERDRKRFAADLHDGAGQLVNLMSHHALDGLGDPDNYDLVTGRFAKIASLAEEAIKEMRLVAYNLRPPELDRLGLTRALEALVDRFNNSSPIEFTCELDQIDLALDDEHKVHLYRIVQESLNNIIRHSQATEARLVIKREAKSVSIEIRDNGQGFEAGANGNRLGLGLPGITERARLLGGRAEIQSAPGQGAKIIILIILREVKS